jgi:hypothetical protein
MNAFRHYGGTQGEEGNGETAKMNGATHDFREQVLNHLPNKWGLVSAVADLFAKHHGHCGVFSSAAILEHARRAVRGG